jgi:hypothetical protein
MKLNQALLCTATCAFALMISLPAYAAKTDRKKDRAKDTSPDFATLDKDANGSVSKAEYVAGLKDKLGEDAAKTRFTELDKNKDDNLSKDELGTVEKKRKRDRKK